MTITVARITGVLLIVGGSLLTLPLGFALAATVNIAVSTPPGIATWFCNASYQNGTCPTSINAGDQVVWTFNGFYGHTTTECGGDMDCNNSNPTPLWDSGVRSNGQTYSYTFNSAGVFLYQCNLHGSAMRGQITVLGGVGGDTQLADIGAGRSPQTSQESWQSIWLGIGAIAGGMIVLSSTAWLARRLATRETSS